MEKLLSTNNLKIIHKKNINTARIALSFYIKITEPEKIPGTYYILNKLLLQGTKKRTAEKLADDFENNGIDFSNEMRYDYIKFSVQALKEDFEKSIEILSDCILNSTLENLKKEINKSKGEILASLDSPSSLAYDSFLKTIFMNHFYGNVNSIIYENLDKITLEKVKKVYKDILNNSEKIVSVVGDIEKNYVLDLINKYFSKLKTKNVINVPKTYKLNDKKIVKIVKNDASQAQIIKGWIMPSYDSKHHVAISALNSILGASGLSSRLFLELREKKGLAYDVRSMYTKYRQTAVFRSSIATAPKNIEAALNGFIVEIDKLKKYPISQKELDSAINNLIGRIQFISETNLQQSGFLGYYELENLGINYEKEFIKKLSKLTPNDIIQVADNYLDDNYVLTILAPDKFLKKDFD